MMAYLCHRFLWPFCSEHHLILPYRCVERKSCTCTPTAWSRNTSSVLWVSLCPILQGCGGVQPYFQTTWGRQEHRHCLLNAILSLGQHGAGRNTGIVCLAPPQPTLQVCGGVKPNLRPYVMEQEHEWFLSITPSHPTLQVCRGEMSHIHPHWSRITSSVCS